MVSTPKAAVADETRPAIAPERPVAHLNARITAYLIDSVLLLAVILIFFVLGGAVMLFTSDLGKEDAPDSAFYAFIAIWLGGTVLFWTAFNLALMRWRGQTAGMFIVAIRTVADDGAPLRQGRLALRWFGLHPLLFHPLLVPLWALFALLLVSITLSEIVLVITVTLVLLCLVAPAVSFVAMLFDAERRAIHDRLARTLVVHIEEPGEQP